MKKILAVSNDHELLELLNGQLSAPGFKMETMDAHEDILIGIKAGKPDILLIDFILGDGNAAAVCHQVTSDPEIHQLPVIILSDLPGIEELAAKLGSFAVIKKPMSTALLAENILLALTKHHPSPNG